jgi:FdhD protein
MFMADSVIIRKRIHRFFESGKVEKVDDDVIMESRLLLRLDGRDFFQAVLTFSQIEEFVIGFLRTRGLIESLQDVASLDVAEKTASVVRTSPRYGSFPDLDMLETTGTKNISSDRLIQGKGIISSAFRVSSETLLRGVGELSRMPLYMKSGATHCAILFSEQGEPVASAEDLGRHNAVDKTIGVGLRNGVDFGKCWLAVSGRLPADMVFKPLLLGIPLVASVSAATTEGIEVAERFGLTVVGFARRGRFNCYCHPHRIIE